MTEDSFLNQETPERVTQNKELKAHVELQNNLYQKLLDKNFSFKTWIFEFSDFASKYDKFLYSVISSSVINDLSDDEVLQLLSNISLITEKVLEDKSIKRNRKTKEEDFVLESVRLSTEKYKMIYKLYDHCNLAIIQRTAYKESSASIRASVDESFNDKYAKEYDEHIKPKIDSFEKDITTQLITLVSIFTALSFVIFGGISVLDNLLQNVRALPVIKTLLIGDLWFICMANLFILFTKFICIIIKKPFKWILIVIILNLILISVLIGILHFGKCTYGTVFFI